MSAAAPTEGPSRGRRAVALPLGLAIAGLALWALAAGARARYGVTGEEGRFTWALAVLAATAALAATVPGWLLVLWRSRRGHVGPWPARGALARARARLARLPLALRALGLAVLAALATLPAGTFREPLLALQFPSLGPLWRVAVAIASLAVIATVLWLLLALVLGATALLTGAGPARDWLRAPERRHAAAGRRLRAGAAAVPAPVAHGLALALLAGVGLVTFVPVVGTPPLDYDNFFELSATLGAPQSLYPGSPGSFFTEVSAGYRPLPYLSMWAQLQLTGLASAPLFGFNIAAAILCAAAVYFLTHRLTESHALAVGTALLLLVDDRVTSSIVQIVTRTQTMACAFGLAALILAYHARPRSPAALAGVGLLLFAALLCKEYAAAAVAAVFVLGLMRHSEGGVRLTAVAVGSFILYATIRVGIDPGGGLAGYCEDMGYFFESREACFGRATVSDAVVLSGSDQLFQHLYNVVGGFVAILLPAFFADDGEIVPVSNLVPLEVVAGVLIFAAAAVGFVARPRLTLPLLAMIAGNALTLFLLYRTRNVLLGATGVYVSAAIGFAFLLGRARERGGAARGTLLGGAGAAAALVLCVVVVVVGVARERSSLDAYRAFVPTRYPCEPPSPDGAVSDPGRLYLDPRLVQAARERYGQEPGCEAR